jgi:DNA processing protein
MDKYSLCFSVSNLGPKSFQKLINYFGDSKKAWEGTRSEYESLGILKLTYEKFENFRTSFDINKYIEKLEKENVQFISFPDKNYPKNLKKLPDPPIGLFVKGDVDLLKNKLSIGVVGTRKVTSYGREVTEFLVSELVNNGVCIISGLALGVDAISHRTALENNGLTIAVLGCGVNCCNPAENYNLYDEILKNNGLIISEYPLEMQPNKGTFPARNRIIAALSDGVLITEAAKGSGSLITAEWGFRLDKKVFAIPGQITSRMSDGNMELLKKGARSTGSEQAILVTNAEDILEEFKIQNAKVKNTSLKLKNLTKEEKKIVSLLQNEEMTIDEVSKKIKIPVSKLFISISSLELSGIVKNNGGKISFVN